MPRSISKISGKYFRSISGSPTTILGSTFEAEVLRKYFPDVLEMLRGIHRKYYRKGFGNPFRKNFRKSYKYFGKYIRSGSTSEILSGSPGNASGHTSKIFLERLSEVLPLRM